MSSNKAVFSVEGVEYAVRKPKPKEKDEAQVVYNRTWRRCAESGDYILRRRLFDVLRKNGMWDDDKEREREEIDQRIAENEKKVLAGGIKLEDGKKLALEVVKDRLRRVQLLMVHMDYDQYTVEAQAQDAQFDFLCTKCIVDNEKGQPVFQSVEDYHNRREEPMAEEGAKQLMSLLFPQTNDWRKKQPENRFLLKYGFVDEELRLVNKEGHLVDEDGRLVNENGQFIKYVDGVKVLCDRDGNPVDESGEPLVASQPFLDDEGNPVV